MKRSNKPIFWSLFGAGGTLAALIGPMLVFITGLAIPLGFLVPRDALSYDRALAFARNGWGKVALFAVVALFMFHGMHRLYHTLHDFGMHVGALKKALFHGVAIAASIAAALLLWVIR